jgi:hypothetical protein
MAVEVEKQQEIEAHPLWTEYKSVQEKLIRAESLGKYELIETFENKLTKLTLKIGDDLNLISINKPSNNNQSS